MKTHLSRRQFGLYSAATLASAAFNHPAARSLASGPDPVDLIHPIIGASTSQKLGEGKTFPGATTPFGLVQLSPDTLTTGDNGPGYSYEHTTIEGFSFLHLSGVGWYGDFGNLQVMPTTGPIKFACGRLDHPGEGWRSRFQHTTEKASANYYAVTLDDYNIRAEATAALRSGMLRFTYPAAHDARIQIDLAHRIGGTSTRQFVTVVAQNAIEGWMQCPPSGGGWGNGDGKADYTIYFRLEFSRPLERFGVWSVPVPDPFPVKTPLVTDRFQTDAYYEMVKASTVISNCREKEGDHLGFYAEFDTHANEQILIKAGVSFVSIEGARKNLAHDLPNWDFDAAHRRGRDQWSKELAKIQIEGGTSEQQATFATALYHAMIDPRVASDVDGLYIDAKKQPRTANGYTRRTIFSGWDVFRTEMPLMTILHPEVVNDEINSLVDLAHESGKGYLERWEIVNTYSGCMDGDPATSVVVDAYRKGIRGFDAERAYAACRQTAAGIGPDTNRPDNDFYMQKGYVPDAVSWTLDNAYFDWCVGRFAQDLGRHEDAQTFLTRAQNYRKIYDPSVQSMRAKDRTGQWIEWKGKTAFGQGCTESNPGQQMWFVPHDVHGLIDLIGREEFVRSLDDFFTQTPPNFGWNPYYNHSNEPVHHVAYLFVYAGAPWLTQKWARRIVENAYHDRVDGICGNDDVGQMSAWYVMSALGFYPVCPGDNTYILGSPLFSNAVIQLDPKYHKGKTFRIAAHNNSAQNCYIASAKLNGKPLERAWITHSEITAGGTLEFEMSSTPNKEWATAKEHLPQAEK